MEWQQQKAAYASILSSVGEAIVLFDIDGRIFQCNRQFSAMLSCLDGDTQDKTVFSLLGSNDSLKERLASAVQGQAATGEMAVVLNGTSLYVAAKWGPLREGAEIFGGYLILTDITQRKNREEMLKERHLRLHSLISKAHIGIVVINQNHKVIESNQRFADMLGYTMEEVIDLHTWDWEADMPKEQIQEVFKDLSKINTTFQTRHRRKDGTMYDANVSAAGTRIQGRYGEYNAVICICEDITAQKETERKLIQSEKKFRNFVENAADIMCITNADGIILYVSPNCEKMWGLTQAEIGGRHFTDLFDLCDRERYSQRMREVFKSGIIPYVEFPFTDREGRRHWYGINGSLSADDKGTPILICSARNIDEKKQYEEKLKYLSTHDQLTGIYNRAYLNTQLEKPWEPALYPISILCCDIDGLKSVNDTLGHDTGDEMIKASARLLEVSLGPQDVLARIGGDEFVIVMPGTDEPRAWKMIRRIKADFKGHHVPKTDYSLGISIGHATVYDPGMSLGKALKEADTNMYIDKRFKEKRAGRHISSPSTGKYNY